jgi:ABC-2 type transport system ATP-binding protein
MEGLREPDGGEVTVLGLRPWPRNPALLPRMGVQLQATSFFERLTAREQLRTFADLYRLPPRRTDEMLEVVGLTSVAATRTEKLSGGQAQRLSIACALVHRPDVLFLDEPTGRWTRRPAATCGTSCARSPPRATRWCSPRTIWTRRRRSASG